MKPANFEKLMVEPDRWEAHQDSEIEEERVALLCYARGVKRKVEFTDTALKALARMGKVNRKFVLDGINVHLVDNDPLEVTRNKFPLKRPSAHAERELRLNNWRVFFTIMEDGSLVIVYVIGEKRGNQLIIEGEEFEL